MYQKMIKHITAADAVLLDVNEAAAEIDRVLQGDTQLLPSFMTAISVRT